MQNAGSRSVRQSGSYGPATGEAQPVQFEVVHPQPIRICNPPRLKKIEIPKLAYAIVMRVLCNVCYDMRWDLVAPDPIS